MMNTILSKEEKNIKTLEKFLLSVLIIFVILIVIIISGLANRSSGKNFERTAGGYYYSVNVEQQPFKWKIGHNDSVAYFKENNNNGTSLDRFRRDVNQISLQKVKLISSLLYLLIIVGSFLFLKKKKVRIPKGALIFIILLGGFAFFKSIVTFVDLDSSINSAKYYYLLLTK
ncbi:hypothetical protein J5Y03_09035 [Bacillus sp. RG28]|uniref:Uncharacterized protein n=1 Tax=Gottfriedia endophytica TaxID=2820819 RepID=A0A940NPT2_9BACI|nr:hypothetical protein [Gottfriedia endophytica]MBP0725333.1 hypothetical protein [Gottfriedia endophytica]